MDKASDFESEDCVFESRRGRGFCYPFLKVVQLNLCLALYKKVYNRYNPRILTFTLYYDNTV